MYEHRRQPILPRRAFARRLGRSAALSGALIAASLSLGVLGYRFTAGLAWIDALLNASMILGGMGPIGELRTFGGKLFASFYALFSGVVFLIAMGVMAAPIFHRFLHKFHLD